jgi:glycosyltransferase involved in cell wall biosynthesis
MSQSDFHPNKARLVVIQRKQFGYHTDSYKLACYLKNDFDITFVCFDGSQARFEKQRIRVHYVDSRGHKFFRALRLIRSCVRVISEAQGAQIFLVYFPFCSLVPIITRRKITLDFRTGCVSRKWYARKAWDMLARVESFFFSRVSVISEGLRRNLRLRPAKSFVVPLGADVISAVPKEFDIPRLFYIGTFNNRHLEQTLEGVSLFLQHYPELRDELRYDIVGFGWRNEEEYLRQTAFRLGLKDNVHFHGQLSHEKALRFFDECNIGVAYVPMTKYYDHQPPTKTYEYILSGMPVIATAITENARIVHDGNGVLCDDTPDSFAQALSLCLSRFTEYESNVIRSTLSDCTWMKIADQFRKQIFDGN